MDLDRPLIKLLMQSRETEFFKVVSHTSASKDPRASVLAGQPSRLGTHQSAVVPTRCHRVAKIAFIMASPVALRCSSDMEFLAVVLMAGGIAPRTFLILVDWREGYSPVYRLRRHSATSATSQSATICVQRRWSTGGALASTFVSPTRVPIVSSSRKMVMSCQSGMRALVGDASMRLTFRPTRCPGLGRAIAICASQDADDGLRCMQELLGHRMGHPLMLILIWNPLSHALLPRRRIERIPHCKKRSSTLQCASDGEPSPRAAGILQLFAEHPVLEPGTVRHSDAEPGQRAHLVQEVNIDGATRRGTVGVGFTGELPWVDNVRALGDGSGSHQLPVIELSLKTHARTALSMRGAWTNTTHTHMSAN